MKRKFVVPVVRETLPGQPPPAPSQRALVAASLIARPEVDRNRS